VIFDEENIYAWLVGESVESAEMHIMNGYPKLIEPYRQGNIKTAIISVPEDDAFNKTLYRVIDGEIRNI
jgi:hypothetical protein